MGATAVAITLVLPSTASAERSAQFAVEVVDHWGLPYQCVATEDLVLPSDEGAIVVFACPPASDEGNPEHLLGWVEGGGQLIVVGGPGNLGSRLGVTARPVRAGHVVVDGLATGPLFAVGGVVLGGTGSGGVRAHWDDGSTAALRLSVGTGSVEIWGVAVWESIVAIMQGSRVTAPGSPAPDGSVPRPDGILRCDDGLVLPFADRKMPSGHSAGPFELTYPPSTAAPVYAHPVADQWRLAVFDSVRRCATELDATLAWIHYWPAGVPAVAHMSHDSDGNLDAEARAALAAFDAADVKVTWCHCHPGGYSADVVAAVARAGHEQALHYNAMGDTELDTWGESEFRAQLEWAQRICGLPIISNKNHYTRWEGYDEFYVWCARAGIELDETRGPSKQGDAGFTFGTAHPWFPLAEGDVPLDAQRAVGEHAGRGFVDVLEIPLHTQDLEWAMHGAVRDVILDGATEVHGLAHFLFHGPHIRREPTVAQAVTAVAQAARERGLPWWTAGQVNAWHRARRKIRVVARCDGCALDITSPAPVSGVGLVIEREPDLKTVVVDGTGTRLPSTTVRRHGRDVVEVRLDLPAGTTTVSLA